MWALLDAKFEGDDEQVCKVNFSESELLHALQAHPTFSLILDFDV